ncbi:MAG: DEAD/DEAH box helicase [Lachnospiraceae bacterium]|nr:DEAD/DEAH box helicase [Lachnospiraceae bacterium]
MSNTILNSAINSKLSNIQEMGKSIVVLKGIPMSVVDGANSVTINLAEAINDKFAYFMKINGNRKYITYEEFLLLADFIVLQYDQIYILNNNIYMEQYPLDCVFEDDVRQGLLNHFMDVDGDEQDDIELGNIDTYISMYVGIKEFNGYLLGAYCDDNLPYSNKIININLFDETNRTLESVENSDDFIDLIEESDYIDLVKKVFDEPDELYIRTSNYTGDIYKLNAHLQILAENWCDWIDFFHVQAQTIDSNFEHRDEYNELLKKYWGYSDFRKLPVYDMAKLDDGKKEVIQVSQENIISDLVQQVENCESDSGDFRDIFVTAPTGAGKSAMFQIPAIYLAEKYNLLTIVISPLIGLMNDQVKNLELKNYPYAKTINSDISPIIKQDIIEKVANGEYHILYISPETLLSRSDVEQLIGDRTIGMIVIDEAHIVTTWGKQFRPDYWYLGDHIRKLRKKQLEKKNRAFVTATFTATAIYHGVEDMYNETVNSLHMLNPITYLGYVKRSDIDIVIDKTQKEKGARREYENDKHVEIEKLLKRALITNKKTLIYFPTVALIDRCYEFLRARHEIEQVAIYHGSLSKEDKQENYEKFMNGEKLVMLATKAFGMGIDIDNIEIVVHFAPTGNVCDYVQEIGRAARRTDLVGEAFYHYDSRDFKHINRLHGLSMIQRYQLIEVIKKIDEVYSNNLNRGGRNNFTRRRNAMLLDAENFTYIFGSPISDEDNSINKVKTALLIIQKDFENKIGFSPITIRPIPMFSIGFFEIDPRVQTRMLKKYTDCLEEIEPERHICRVNLSKIWNKDYSNLSFPKFKYMLYNNDEDLNFNSQYTLHPALCVSVDFADDYNSQFEKLWRSLQGFVKKKVISSEHTAMIEIAEHIASECSISKYKAQAICEVVLASMDSYRRNFSKGTTPIAQEKTTVSGQTKYQFNTAVNSYFSWVEKKYRKIVSETNDGKLYLINDNGNSTKEISVVLGILESLNVLAFEMIGGANSQLYIYINQIQSLKNILKAPYLYHNRLLEAVSERHLISVKMLTHIYEGDFKNEEIWNMLEDYFLGNIPEKVKRECIKENPDMKFDD